MQVRLVTYSNNDLFTGIDPFHVYCFLSQLGLTYEILYILQTLFIFKTLAYN